MILRYRLGLPHAGQLAIDQIKWLRELPPPSLESLFLLRSTAFFIVFLGGLSLPISMALLCHLLGINIRWVLPTG